MFLDQAAAAELAEAFENGVHGRAYLGGAGRSEVLQELVAGFHPIGVAYFRIAVLLSHQCQDRAEAV
jgi:hypothetical protein